MVDYFRNPSMVFGGEFRCYNCNNLLIGKIKGNDYELDLKCSRCDSEIIIKMKEPMGNLAIDHLEKKNVK